MTENVIDLTVDEIVNNLFEGKDTFLTPYRVAKIVSQYVYVREQMMYNYVKNELIPSEVVDGRRMIGRQDAIDWSVKYITKKMNKND